jgi:Ras-related protein Rab-2A
MSTGEAEITAKVIVVGPTSSGKSCLLLRFTHNTFNLEHETTIGVDFSARTIESKSQKLRLHVWDTAGQESFQSVARNYYRDACAAVLVYDVTDRASFEQLPKWLAAVREYSGNKELTVILVANKCDLAEQRVIAREQGEGFARQHNLLFQEVSAKTGDGVGAAFLATANTILRKIDQGALVVDDPSSGVRHTDRRTATPQPVVLQAARGSAAAGWCCAS